MWVYIPANGKAHYELDGLLHVDCGRCGAG